jgi:hypothetical protein
MSSPTVLRTPYGGRLTVLPKQGSSNVTVLLDSRFLGNDRLSCFLIIEEIILSFDLKSFHRIKFTNIPVNQPHWVYLKQWIRWSLTMPTDCMKA